MRTTLWLIAICVAVAAAPAYAAESPRQVRIGHYQCACHQGDFEANLATLCTGLAQAVDASFYIVSFPENFLTGYFAREQDARKHMFAIDSSEMKRVLEATASCDTVVVVGFNEQRGEKDLQHRSGRRARPAAGCDPKALPY